MQKACAGAQAMFGQSLPSQEGERFVRSPPSLKQTRRSGLEHDLYTAVAIAQHAA